MARLLGESFKVLAREQPALHARLCAELAGRTVELCMGAERFTVGFGASGARLGGVGGTVDARVTVAPRTVEDVLDARRALVDAVLAGEVEVVGSMEALAVLHAGLVTYGHGAVRCPSFPELLERFRAICREQIPPSAGGAHGR